MLNVKEDNASIVLLISYGSIEIFTIKKVLVVLGPFFIVKSTRLVVNLGMIHDMIRLIAANENTLLNNFRVIISSCQSLRVNLYMINLFILLFV